MLDKVALDQPIDQADGSSFLTADHAAAGGHFKRLGNARDARQALGATSAGEESKLDLGDSEFCGGNGDAVVTAERDLKPPAERGAVDRGNDGLGTSLDPVDDFGEPWKHRRLAKFGDVGAGEERLPGAGNDHRLDACVALGLLDRGDEALANGGAERVHRGVIGRNDQDVTVAGRRDGGSHAALREGMKKGLRVTGGTLTIPYRSPAHSPITANANRYAEMRCVEQREMHRHIAVRPKRCALNGCEADSPPSTTSAWPLT